jgi:hypothetical protein
MNLNNEEKIDEFSKLTKKIFYFLESDYGYTINELEKRNFKYPLDAEVLINYSGKNIAVSVFWYLSESYIGIGLYELQDGKITEKVSFYGDEGYSRAINFDSLVMMLTKGKVKSTIPRNVDKAHEMVRKDMAGILKTLAGRLKKYAPEILKGDTSIFPQVQEYHKKLWGFD